MRPILFFIFVILQLNVAAQNDLTEKARPIVEEGKRLYRSEMASWYGTDLFLENYKDRKSIGGYFSYSSNDTAKCIFFSKSDNPKVIGTMTFDSTYDTKTATTDLTERDFTSVELDIYSIRKAALDAINSDTLFRAYKNTNFNLIPMISEGEKKVYVLTGTTKEGVVIFGNDYLLTFSADNKLQTKKQLHQSIIITDYKEKGENGEVIVGAMHTHLPETGDYITATDICTLMLYEKFTTWKQYSIVSKEYLNIWNCETNTLVVIPMSTIKKINKDQEKRNKKNKE